ncbi:hypothetical protein SAMN02745824_3347 [Parasphingorhabdus marina DSM 22363]|uniref:General secretion pathway protein L n=1 Tax=Parasphingorhabdus marina DSM 22363 TaxID=1123272 RepID=A0A1N6HLH0_9SPHN|nr:hypothetical protein [Parasphingorhabdus marina]SIO20597.1 hypothetical protein SAMN02745824_3347 [Parasphingorhabdus marina DSM 22363]
MNAPTQNLSQRAGAFWHWWSDELRELLPASLKNQPTERDRFDIFAGDEETVIEYVHNGAGEKMVEAKRLESLEQDSWDQIVALADQYPPRLFLQGRDYLAIPVKLPKASFADIRSALQLQLANLVPLKPEYVDWDFAALERDDKHVFVSLIVAKSARLDEIETLFAEKSLMPPTFCVEHQGRIAVLRRPLLLSSKPADQNKKAFALAAAGLLACTPLVTWAGAEILLSREETRIAELESVLEPRLAQEKQILAEEMVRRAAAPLLKMPSASNRLEALAANLPDTDWTSSVTQDGQGRMQFLADMEDRERAEVGLSRSKIFENLEPIEELDAENTRDRVRYEVGR